MSIEEPLSNNDISKISTYHVGVLQALVHRNLRRITDNILSPYEITKMQWLIIGVIYDSGKLGIRLTDLANEIGTTIPYITKETNLLLAKKIIKRSASSQDNRIKLVTINPKFLPTFKRIEADLRKGLREAIYSKIDPGEFITYLKVLNQLSNID